MMARCVAHVSVIRCRSAVNYKEANKLVNWVVFERKEDHFIRTDYSIWIMETMLYS